MNFLETWPILKSLNGYKSIIGFGAYFALPLFRSWGWFDLGEVVEGQSGGMTADNFANIMRGVESFIGLGLTHKLAKAAK